MGDGSKKSKPASAKSAKGAKDAKGAKSAKVEAPAESTITKNPAPGPRTLAIDIGGTGLKAKVLDAKGQALSERVRVETPRPANPKAVLAAIWGIVDPLPSYDRVSVGFPGVVVDGVTRTAPNLDPAWTDYALARELAKHTGKPTRVLNDAGVQGHGVISGKGVEMVLTLGTGMGCALFVDGKYVPNLELAHHPLFGDKTYEQFICDRALKRIGAKKWSRRVLRVLAQVQPIFNPQRIYLGGGNARNLEVKLPENVTVVDNAAGLFGGIALWRDNSPAAPSSANAPSEKAANPRPSKAARDKATSEKTAEASAASEKGGEAATVIEEPAAAKPPKAPRAKATSEKTAAKQPSPKAPAAPRATPKSAPATKTPVDDSEE